MDEINCVAHVGCVINVNVQHTSQAGCSIYFNLIKIDTGGTDSIDFYFQGGIGKIFVPSKFHKTRGIAGSEDASNDQKNTPGSLDSLVT